MGIRKGFLRSRVPMGNGTRFSKQGGVGVVKQPSTEQVMAMPHFGRFCWAVREDAHDPPTHLLPVLGAGSFPEVPSFSSPGQRRWGLGAEGFRFADLPGLGYKRSVPGRRGRVQRAESPARRLAASPRRRISAIPHPA